MNLSVQFGEHGYRVIYVHSGFSPPVWLGWWLWGVLSRISRTRRKNVNAVSIIHASIGVRMIMFALRAMVGKKFWEKVEYADRLEEIWLDDIVSESETVLNIPQIIFSYEGNIVEEAEGLRSWAVMMGAPLGPREQPTHHPEG